LKISQKAINVWFLHTVFKEGIENVFIQLADMHDSTNSSLLIADETEDTAFSVLSHCLQ
jgi:hypothetical protein